MKRIISIIIVLISFSLKAQDINKIKDQNVFFILFDESNDLMKKQTIKSVRKIDKNIHYSFCYNFYKINGKEFNFSFNHSKYRTLDDEHNDINERMVYRVSKSFLRKNKDIIITRSFMEKVGEDVIIDLLFRGSKYIFIIDKSEMKNCKILLREVRFDYIAQE